jgi:hypothetical protein
LHYTARPPCSRAVPFENPGANMSTKTLLLPKKAAAAELKIPVSIPQGKTTITGWITGIINILPKPYIAKLYDLVKEDELHDYVQNQEKYSHLHDRIASDSITADELLLRIIYQDFVGIASEGRSLEGEEAWKELLEGEFSSYLVPAAMGKYYEQYANQQKGNSRKSRGR